ncbi:MAG: polysaccharide biosynthesis C-terminal domain-containing protein [Vulcanimicrobiaceae bacterium]
MGLLANAAFLSSARVCTLVAAVMLNVVTARALGPEGRGSYSLPGIDASLASTFILGLQTATSFFLLKRRAGSSVARPAALTASAFVTIGCIIATSIALLNRHAWAAVPAMLYLPCSATLSVVAGYWIGRDRVKTCGLINVATTVSTLACVTFALLIFGRTAQVAIGGWLAGQALVASCALATMARDVRRGGDPVSLREYARFAMRTGAVNMVTLLSYRIDVLVVAAIAPIEVLGLYGVAVAGAESTLAVTYAANQVAAPRLGTANRSDGATFAARCTRHTVLAAAIVATFVGLLAPFAVSSLFGQRFLPLVPSLRVLLVGVVALTSGGTIANYFVLNVGMVRLPLATGALSATISGALTFALFPRIGMIGAACAITTAYVVGQCVAVAYFCRYSGIHPRRVLVIEPDDFEVYRNVVTSLWARVRSATLT